MKGYLNHHVGQLQKTIIHFLFIYLLPPLLQKMENSRWVVANKEESVENYKLLKKYNECISSVLISNEEINKRFDQVARDIVEHYKERPFLILIVLKGAAVLFGDLYKALIKAYSESDYENNLFYETVRLKSYENEESTGKVNLNMDEEIDLKGKEILIIEDIVDTGHTMRTLLAHLKTKEPASIRMFSFILKEGRTEFEFPIEHVGFLIPNKFVIGYGMDFNQYFRDIPHLCVISKKGIEKFKV